MTLNWGYAFGSGPIIGLFIILVTDQIQSILSYTGRGRRNAYRRNDDGGLSLGIGYPGGVEAC